MPIIDFVVRDVGPTSTPSDTAAYESDAQRIAHVTSAVIGCILGGALAGAVFALGLALIRFRRRKLLRRRLYERVAGQINRENEGNTISEETRERLIEERLRIVVQRIELNNRPRRPSRPVQRRPPRWIIPPLPPMHQNQQIMPGPSTSTRPGAPR